MLEDIEGKQVPAHTIFAMSINFLKMEILKSLTKHSGYTIEDVHFIITIPAVWTDAAKQFMREAALEVNKLVSCILTAILVMGVSRFLILGYVAYRLVFLAIIFPWRMNLKWLRSIVGICRKNVSGTKGARSPSVL